MELHLVREPDAQPQAAARFAREAGPGLAFLDWEDLSEEDLSLPFALSAWIRGAGVDLTEAFSGLLTLRHALLESSGLDRASEPVPLGAGDQKRALIGLAQYTYQLIHRAARHDVQSPTEVVQRALAVID